VSRLLVSYVCQTNDFYDTPLSLIPHITNYFVAHPRQTERESEEERKGKNKESEMTARLSAVNLFSSSNSEYDLWYR
jgi:hypothetical protein